ncbi:MAG: lipoprotein signal peptidase [Bacteroidaceae bacterium]|nr:lipoprotein signal peptidase [Bacteroidaceae bacterium]
MGLPLKSRAIVAWLLIFGAIIIDQIIKVVVKLSMYLHESIPVFGDWFYISFTENPGMAFGLEFFDKIFLTLFRLVAVSFLVYYLYKIVRNPRFPTGYVICIAMILAGAAGNIIDCLFYGEIFTGSEGQIASLVPWGEGYGSFMYGKVVDMFYFPLFSFYWPDWLPFIGGDFFLFFSPIFNFADACVSCSVIVLFIFYSKYVNMPFRK